MMNLNLKALAILAAFVGATAVAATGAHADNESGVPIPPEPKVDKRNAEKYGKALAYYMDKRDTGWRDYYSKGRMTLVDASGDRVQRNVTFMVLEGDEGDRTVTRFRSPADIRGVAALVHEKKGGTDDTWLYLPASRRTRRISGANRTASFQGTEFTYEDLGRVNVERYTWKFLDEGKSNGEPVYKLEARPTYQSGYSKLHVYIHKDHWRVEKIEYFDHAGRPLKTFTQKKWKLMHGRYWRPRIQVMENKQTRKVTHIAIPSMYLNLSLYKRSDGSARDNLSASDFTKRALENN